MLSFLKLPKPPDAVSQSAGTAKGRAPGTTPHEACFNVAWDTAQPRERAPAVSLVLRGSASLPWGRYRADFVNLANARCASSAGMV